MSTYLKRDVPSDLAQWFEPLEIGLEESPDAYVAQLVAVFREVRRVLRDDGTLFLNLGDSYYSNPGNGRGGGSTLSGGKPHLSGAQRVVACGTSGKGLEGSTARGCLCGSLCGVCRAVYRRTTHNAPVLAAMLRASLPGTNHAHTESAPDRLPTSDSKAPAARTASAIQDRDGSEGHEAERLRALLVSTTGESSPPLLDECLLRPSRGECLLCARSLGGCAPSSEHTSACTCGTVKPLGASGVRMSGISFGDSAYPHSTIAPLKPKDLIGIPWRVAFALQADGWYLRSDIVWSKPNPMPESVRDRCTRSHEYIFMLTKSARYWYDAAAIAEPAKYHDITGMDDTGFKPPQDFNGKHSGGSETLPPRKRDKQRGHSRRHAGFNDRWDAMEKALQCSGMRNKRDVWTVATQPYSEAHFATFPEALIEPCIVAGCPKWTCASCGIAINWRNENTDLSVVQNAVSDIRLPRGAEQVLQQGLRVQVEAQEAPEVQAMPQTNCDDAAQPERHFLQQDVREPLDGTTPPDNKGLRDHQKGIQGAVPTGASDGDENRLCVGASAGYGAEIASPAIANGDRSSSKRGQARQPGKESRSASKAATRSAAQAEKKSGRKVPMLRSAPDAIERCPHCGAEISKESVRPGVVFDPFCGSGTTLAVANRLGRSGIGLELNPEYIEIARRRIFSDVTPKQQERKAGVRLLFNNEPTEATRG